MAKEFDDSAWKQTEDAASIPAAVAKDGLGYGVDGHRWAADAWGYKGAASTEDLTRGYEKLLTKAWGLKDSAGLSAVIYTQLTDLETECNGLLTYDRAVNKVDPERAAAVNTGQKPTTWTITEVLPTSQLKGFNWHYTFEPPAADWFTPAFGDSTWKEGPGGFGMRGTPGAVVRTEWTTADIWLRREFDWSAATSDTPILLVHHDEGVEIYINGVLATKAGGFVSEYEEMAITPEGKAALNPGKNVMAVHCHQIKGGQYVDVGICTESPNANR